MSALLTAIKNINEFLWSGPLLFLLMGTHLYFTMKLHVPQKNILRAILSSVTPDTQKEGKNLSVFATLATTLAATLGTGNIVGVSGRPRCRILVLDHRNSGNGNRLRGMLFKCPF